MVERRPRLLPLAAVAAALGLAACSGPEASKPAAPPPVVEDRPPAVAPPAAPPAAPAASPESPTIGGDGSAIQLSALSAADIDANPLEGELGCGFSTPAGAVLLTAKGDVASRDPAWGLVKVTDVVERVGAPGGFDAMVKGAVFSGAGKTVRVVLTGPPVSGGESPPRPATLTYQRADGASRVIVGLWMCGP